VLILAEMLAVREGFGYVLWHAYEFMRMDLVVAAMLTIGLCGFVWKLMSQPTNAIPGKFPLVVISVPFRRLPAADIMVPAVRAQSP